MVLFSQEGCAFCATVREHYLRPLALQKPARVTIAEIELGNSKAVVDWQGVRRSHAELARTHGVRFAPTVMFFDAQGRELAPSIVGLSRDFFGAYLDNRIASALAALGGSSASR